MIDPIKELYLKLESCNDDSCRLDVLAALSTQLLNVDLIRCTEVVEQIGELAQKNNDPTAYGYYHSSLGRIHFKKSHYPEAANAFIKAIEYAKVASLPMLESNCNHSLGMVFWKESKMQESLEYSLKALEYFESIEDKTGNRAMCYNSIGNVYERLGDFAKAEEAYLKGLEILKQHGEFRMLQNVMGNLGVMKIRKEEYKEALAYLEPVLDGFKKIRHSNGIVLSLTNIGQAYFGLKQYAKSMKYYLQALKELKGSEYKFGEAAVYRELGKLYMALEGPEEALKHYKKGMELVKEIAYHSGACEFYQCLAELYEATGEVAKALAEIETGLALAEEHQLTYEAANLMAVKNRIAQSQSQVA